MVVAVPSNNGRFDIGRSVMRDIDTYCDELWIDGNPVPITARLSMDSDKPVHSFKYVFKPGVDYIPDYAFVDLYCQSTSSIAAIKSITLPEGLKKLKNSCFCGSHFEGNLILPNSLERICVDALSCTVDGVFHLPNTVKYISSLPKSEERKPEIILPEGMISYTPDSIVTNHLHIPSTLKVCHPRSFSTTYITSPNFSGTCWNVQSITIAPDNPYFVIRDDTLVSLQEEKRERLKKMDEISWNAIVDAAFKNTGLTTWKNYNDRFLSVNLNGLKKSIYFRFSGIMTPAKAQQAADIALKFSMLFDSLSQLKDNLLFGREYLTALSKNECMFSVAFFSCAVELEVHLKGKSVERKKLYGQSQKLFSKIVRLVGDIERRYGLNHLHFTIR